MQSFLNLCPQILVLIERSMSLGVKNIWNYIKSSGKTGRDFIGMRATLKRLLKIMQTTSLLKMMMKISLPTGLPLEYLFYLLGFVSHNLYLPKKIK